MPSFKFTANVPVEADIKYLDIVPGTYGEQIRLKGKIDGAESVAYLPGKRDEVLATLIHHGIIANRLNGYPTSVAEGSKGIDLPPLKRKVRLVSEQPAGQKYGVLKVLNGSGAETVSAGGEMGKPNAGTPSAAPSAELVSDDARDKALLAQRAVFATRMKQSVAYVLENIEPLYKAKGIGMTDDGVYKHAYSIWQEWCERGIIQ